jgi:hypothetical protein
MGTPLNKNSLIECPIHGDQLPAFICRHLQYGEKIGFHTPDDPPEKEWPFKNAWCDKCHEVLLEEGEWNCMYSKGFGQIGDKNKRGFRSQLPFFCSLSNL